jgi:hypothetical protein
MIRDTTAQRIAADWHGGGGSKLYQFASTGAIPVHIIDEMAESGMDQRTFDKMAYYMGVKGERLAQKDWYRNVICKAQKG